MTAKGQVWGWVMGSALALALPAARAGAQTQGAQTQGAQTQVSVAADAARAKATTEQRELEELHETGGAIYRSGLPILQDAEEKASLSADEAAGARAAEAG